MNYIAKRLDIYSGLFTFATQTIFSMKRVKMYIFLSGVTVFMIVACTFFIVYHNSKERIETEINHVFSESIRQDYDKRLLPTNYYHSRSTGYLVKDFAATPTTDRKIKKYTIRTHKGLTTYTFKNGIDEQRAKMLMNQYLLAELNPIKPDELKTIFQGELSKRNIQGAVGIACFYKDSVRFSAGDSIVPTSAYQTPRHTLDINGQLRVQAWVDYTPSSLSHHADSTVFWLIAQCLFVGGVISFWFYRERRKKRSRLLAIDMEKQELRIGDCTCDIRKMDLALLNIFAGRMEECVSREEIKQMFWATDDNANEKIDAHVKAIRKVLKAAPAYRLVTVRGKGFYLSCSLKDSL